MPKAIRSLKSKDFLSISITPILCRIEASHPATRLFLLSFYHISMERLNRVFIHLEYFEERPQES